MKQRKPDRRIATGSAVAALAVALLSSAAAEAQSIMRTPNLNIGSRTPNITAINPNAAGRAVGSAATLAGRGTAVTTTTGNIAGRGSAVSTGVANTAVGRTTTNVTTTTNVGTTAVRTTATTSTGSAASRATSTAVTGTNSAARVTSTATSSTSAAATRVTPKVTTAVTARVTPNVTTTLTPAVTPVITPRVAVVVPTLPYVRYSPNLYPACSYALRDASGDCAGAPVGFVDSGGGGGGGPPRSQNGNSSRRNASQAALIKPYVDNQIIAEVDRAQADQLARRHRLRRIDSQDIPLLGTSLTLFGISDRRSLETVRTALAADAAVRSVQLNLRYLLQDQKSATAEGDPAQYALKKLRLPEAHGLSRGANVKVAVIDSGIDIRHPELADSIADSFNALGGKESPHVHGTGIAGAIVSHARLMGSAPAAKLVAIRAFGASPNGAESTSFVIIKSLDFAALHGAQIVNMSFAGPKDALVERGIAAAAARGMVLVAASGNAGPKSPPLYPAANPEVIAVSATDAADKLFAASNRGSHIAVAAPGVDIFLPAPDGKYQMTSGTSFSAAYVSGLAALLIERNPQLRPEALRDILMKTARDLGPPGRDDLFGAGQADAFGAVLAVTGPVPVAGVAEPPTALADRQAVTTAQDSDSDPAVIAAGKPASAGTAQPKEP